jgi:hypothetical protein
MKPSSANPANQSFQTPSHTCLSLHGFWERELGTGLLLPLTLTKLIPKFPFHHSTPHSAKKLCRAPDITRVSPRRSLRLPLRQSFTRTKARGSLGVRITSRSGSCRRCHISPALSPWADVHGCLATVQSLACCGIAIGVGLLSQGCDLGREERVLHCRFVGMCIIESQFREQLRQERDENRVVVLR